MINDQGEKRIKAVEKNGKHLVESNLLFKKDSPSFLLQKVIFNNLISKRYNQILELSKKNNYDSTYYCRNKNIADNSFNNFDEALSFLKKIRDGNLTLGKVKEN